MKKFVLFLVSLILMFSAVVSVYASIPDATEYFYVNDFAEVLSDEALSHIYYTNEDLFARTGAQIVVTTVNFTNGMSMEDYSLEMFNSWEIGSEKNNGMLLLLSIGDDDYIIQLGDDLAKKLSAGEIDDIQFEYLEPHFAARNYEQGVIDVFNELVRKVERLYANAPPYQEYPNPAGVTANQSSGSSSGMNFFNILAEGFWKLMRFILVVIVIIAIVVISLGSSFIKRKRRSVIPPPIVRRGFFGSLGRFYGNTHHHHHHPSNPVNHHRPPSPPPVSRPPVSGFGKPSRPSGGGGFSSGGGIGRSSGGFGSSPRSGGMGGSRSGGIGGGPRSGGGGFSSGGGVGRRK